jgi:methylated-DNA-protein-cysteine methyltransferase related protein
VRCSINSGNQAELDVAEHDIDAMPMERSALDPRTTRILGRVRAIPAGFVRTYGDIDPKAPRLVGRILATTHERLPWHRVVRADGSIPMGGRQRELLLREGVPMRGDRVDLRRARVPLGIRIP